MESIAPRLLKPEGDPDRIPNDGKTYSKNSGWIDSSIMMYPVEEFVEDTIPVYSYGHYYEANAECPITNENKESLRLSRARTWHKEYVVNLDFNLGFKEEGDYILYFEFYSTNGRIYTKKIRFSICNPLWNRVEVMKLEPAEADVWGEVIPNLDLYQYAEVDALPDEFEDHDILLQSHFFSAKGNPDKAGLHHTLIGIFEKNYEFDGEPEFDPELTETMWKNDTARVKASDLVSGDFEGRVITWKQCWNGEMVNITGENLDYWQEKWDELGWGELNEETSAERSGERMGDVRAIWDKHYVDWNDPDNMRLWESLWKFDMEFNQENSDAMDGVYIPDTPVSGTLNNLIQHLVWNTK